jgi:acyl-coenzyme A synthetase/AMP-(fatty) acid ligase|eukprot:COSAG06_NODE_3031_length_5940_cov_25.990755_4_plen_107_part_00
MVKVRGYSVVLGAVEVAVMKHPGVASAVVLAEGDEVTKRIFLRAIIILKMIIFQDRLGTNIGKRVQKRVALSYRPTLERNGSSLTWCAVFFSHLLYIYIIYHLYSC